MDDLLLSSDFLVELETIARESRLLFDSRGFTLSKWVSIYLRLVLIRTKNFLMRLLVSGNYGLHIWRHWTEFKFLVAALTKLVKLE